MALRLTQRQLEALTADAVKAGREAERTAAFDRLTERFSKRVYAEPRLTTWAEVETGTALLSCDDGDSFYYAAVITGVYADGDAPPHNADTPLRLSEGERWVTWKGSDTPGTGGQRVRLSDTVLVAS